MPKGPLACNASRRSTRVVYGVTKNLVGHAGMHGTAFVNIKSKIPFSEVARTIFISDVPTAT